MITSDTNFRGNFDSIEAVWEAIPYGGVEGDYLNIQGVKYRWNKYLAMWENAEVVTETPARETVTFDEDVNMQNNLTVAGVLRAKKFVVDDLPTGIEDVEITESAVSGGNNVITFTYTNGETQTFNIKNGEAGKTQAAFAVVADALDKSGWDTAKCYLVLTETEGEFDVYSYEAETWSKIDTIEVDLNYDVQQTTGQSTTAVMSQKAVTDNFVKIGTSINADLDIDDENNNVIARFSGGHIKTKLFDSRDLKTLVADSSGTNLDITDEQNNVIARFSGGHIKTKLFDSSIKKYRPYQKRTFFMHDVDTINYLVTDFTAETIDTYEQAVIYKDNCVLYLPTSYTQEGTPTKIIIYCKHGASTIEQSADDILTGTMGRIFNYMLYLGYGILAADGVPNGWATALGLGERVVGNYVAVESTIRAFDYVKNNYNIDADNVFIFGYSQGGHYVQNVIDNSNIPFAAAAELSPVCSMRYHQWDLDASGTIGGVSYTKLARLNIARMFNFPAVSNNTELLALQYDAIKTIGYDPWNRNVEDMYTGFVQDGSLWKLPSGTSLDDITMKKHIKCPLKVWAAGNDTSLGVDVMKVFVKAVKNSGQAADMQLYTTGGHNIPNNQSSIGTFNYDGTTYNLYPIAKDIAGWFFRFGGYELN